MTVSILVSNEAGAAVGEIPIATSKVFADIWIPLATNLGLKLIPSLSLGNVHFDQESIREFVEELRLMQSAMVKNKEPSLKFILERLEHIIGSVEKRSADKGFTYDIG